MRTPAPLGQPEHIMDERTQRQHLLATGILEWESAITHVGAINVGAEARRAGIVNRLRTEQHLLLLNWVVEFGTVPDTYLSDWVVANRTDLIHRVREWFTEHELAQGGGD